VVQMLGVAPRNRECTWRLARIAEKQDPTDFTDDRPRSFR